jgi:hypothetical protein
MKKLPVVSLPLMPSQLPTEIAIRLLAPVLKPSRSQSVDRNLVLFTPTAMDPQTNRPKTNPLHLAAATVITVSMTQNFG